MPPSVIQLLHSQACESPDSNAIVTQNRSISYGKLYGAAITLAQVLRQKGIRSNDRIPVVSSRCIEGITALISVLILGACYVPVDLDSWSTQCILNVLSRVAPKVIINTGNHFGCSYEQVSSLTIQSCVKNSTDWDGNTIPSPSSQSPESLAYIIFTSGTTGTPKGVMISQGSLAHYVQQGSDEKPFNLAARPFDRVLLLSFAFDAFTCITFSTLCHGGTLCLSDPSTFVEDARSCTILPITPSLLNLLPSDGQAYDKVRSIFLGGQAAQPALVGRWSSSKRKLFNGYGATEAKYTSLIGEMIPEQPITLGNPMDGGEVFLLDDDLEESSRGEIAITGAGLALGYFMDPVTTENRFRDWRSKRIYLTGDIAQATEHGLVFLGRKDSMVKNRDFLINLEAQAVPILLHSPDVKDAIAFMHHDMLSAFICPASVNVTSLREELKRRTDSFLVPDCIRTTDTLPLTANGKVDIPCLKQILEVFQDSAPTDHTNKLSVLRSALSRSFAVTESDVNDDLSFLDQGGNSLSAIKTLSQLHSHGWTIPMRKMYEFNNIASLSVLMEPLSPNSARNSTIPSNVDTKPMRLQPLTPTNSQLHMIRSTLKHSDESHILTKFTIDTGRNGMTPSQLEEGWRQVFGRHAIFKYTFDLASHSVIHNPTQDISWSTRSVYTESVDTAILHSFCDTTNVGFQTVIAEYFFWVCATAITQLAILGFYIRLFGVKTWFLRTCYVASAIVVGWLISAIIAELTACIPLNKLWNPEIPGTCIDDPHMCTSIGVLHVVFDCTILALPIPLIWRLQMRRSVRFFLSILLSIAVFASICSILRMSCLLNLSGVAATDVTEDYQGVVYQAIEVPIAIFCICVPNLAPVWEQFLKTSLGSTMRRLFSTLRSTSKQQN